LCSGGNSRKSRVKSREIHNKLYNSKYFKCAKLKKKEEKEKIFYNISTLFLKEVNSTCTEMIPSVLVLSSSLKLTPNPW
jgi:hypothetical protein